MRPGTGCRNCRERHIKCVVAKGQTSCTRCVESNRKCKFLPKYRFQLVSYVDTASSGVRSRTHLLFDDDQEWVQTHVSGFVLEDGSGVEYDAVDDVDEQRIANTNGHNTDIELPTGFGEVSSPAATRSTYGQPNVEPPTLEENETDWITLSHPGELIYEAPSFSTPATIGELSRRYEDGIFAYPATPITPLAGGSSNATSPAASLPTPGAQQRPQLSRREVFLLHHFIHKIAPWIDCCDFSNHFALEVPRRAVQKAMVLHSLLALSSRHLAIQFDQSQDEASFYHGECLRLLIDALSDSEATYDDNLLATVVLLRVYEELEQSTDSYLHLAGTGRLLSAIPTFAHSGGLAEAACWQSLRQDIFVSLVNAQPPTLRLESYDQSSAFKFRDDAACANVIVLLFAKVLRLAFTTEYHRQDVPKGNWAELEADIERWFDRRQRLFQPIYEESLDLESGKPFPVCCLLNPPQVVAEQYFLCCRVFLAVYRPTTESASAFQIARQRRNIEKVVANYLASIVGLAVSNEMVENANFTAHHLLRIYGYCIANQLQRNFVLHFLGNMQSRMGWKTGDTVTLLKSQWRELDNAEV